MVLEYTNGTMVRVGGLLVHEKAFPHTTTTTTTTPITTTTPPKILDAYALARGTAPTTVIAPAPPTARPDSAH